ncbi:glycoside hydrolase family 88 protein [Flavivirga amylovorans]|uniref:Glycoside hydrolase family 88 protein n=1 Tax=Flavivirga amylovorans TaxID=870486 RepID=A0ABT8X1H7_9FLAO|nr:glycoside hydrolase family 88 protein [Flavivirga amylovorans]MDO5987577.1 glycoside hydrolase family 88 protein [Flavivirga amylovorans]
MTKNQLTYSLLFTLILTASCRQSKNIEIKDTQIQLDSPLNIRFGKLVTYPADSSSIPRSIDLESGKEKTTSSRTWTSGFFAGNLWYLYVLTHNELYKTKAIEWTEFIEREKNNDTDHDIGFKVFNSFGNAYKITNNDSYAEIIAESAKTLITRYDANIKAIKSWESKEGKWEYPVIIDNMMNLELLFEASLITKDSIYYHIAVEHANTTLKNHFRKDNSTYHVVDYNATGKVKAKMTHQGLHNESAWARGQAWAIYGYTMAYRFTKDEAYLNQAVQAAAFYLNHKKLSSDGIPFWDFNDPNIPNAPKDVSSATIIASAFFELAEYTKNSLYLNYANKILETLKQPQYLLGKTINAPFILNRSTGNYNKNSEIDCPIVYADYYFLEALIRQQSGLFLIQTKE